MMYCTVCVCMCLYVFVYQNVPIHVRMEQDEDFPHCCTGPQRLTQSQTHSPAGHGERRGWQC